MMTVRCKQFHTEAVDRSEKRAIECLNHIERKMGLENLLPGALLHFIRGAIGVGHHNQLRQAIDRVRTLGDLNDAIRDRTRLPRPGRCDHGKILVQFAVESMACVSVNKAAHARSSSCLTSARAGCVIAHFSCNSSSSIASVASG